MPAAPYISIVVACPGEEARALAERWQRRAEEFGLSAEVIVAERSMNAGIRQARGEFILTTAIDLELSDELMRFLAARQLRKGMLYRIDLREGQTLHAREGTFRVTAEGLREKAAEDIARESGIHFGEGWFPPERDAESGEVFRWIGDEAEVVVAGGGALELDVEPGPGVGPLPQVLRVLDGRGAQVAEWSIAGRASLRLWAPAGAGRFRLAAGDGGRAVLDDLRILDFRVFRCDQVRSAELAPRPVGLAALRPTLTRLALSGGIGGMARAVRLLRAVGPDIFGAGIEYWGTGWHRLEESGAEKFRWAATDAEVVVRAGESPKELCLLVEPGPSLQGQAFELQIRLAGGATIGKARVSGLTLVRVPLPVSGVAALLLSPDRQGEAVPGDSRVLNFRVLACEVGPSERVAAEVSAGMGWTAVTVEQRAAAIDLPVRLEKERREIAEIGKPAFLHTNGCEFLLMERERWFDLRGLPETEYPPGYMNVLFCYAAHFAGATEEVLREPLRVERKSARERGAEAPDRDLIWLITQMRRLRTPAVLSMDTWGVK